jgi:hypothetical protein
VGAPVTGTLGRGGTSALRVGEESSYAWSGSGSFGFGARRGRAGRFVLVLVAAFVSLGAAVNSSVAASAFFLAFAADRFRPPREPRRVGFFVGSASVLASVLASGLAGLSVGAGG